MYDPRLTIPSSLVPHGLEGHLSEKVDIYPVSTKKFTANLIANPIPENMSSEDKEAYRLELLGERDFLVSKGREIPQIPNPQDVDAVHDFFVTNGLGKVGIRNINFSDGQLSADYTVVPMPAYNMFKECDKPDLREFGAVLGVSLVVVTSDNKLVIQDRSPSNSGYPRVPGVSFGGTVDAPRTIDQQLDLLQHSLYELIKECQEEGNFAPKDSDVLSVKSLQIDKLALHHELVLLIKTGITSKEVEESVNGNTQIDDGIDFGEDVIILDPDENGRLIPVIETLLFEFNTPTPTTHGGAFLSCGSEHSVTEGSHSPGEWFPSAFVSMIDNYQRIDRLTHAGQYTSKESPETQGLPSTQDELERLFHGRYQYISRNK